MVFKYLFWSEIQARNKYISLRNQGHTCQMSDDGRGVIVKLNVDNETFVTANPMICD